MIKTVIKAFALWLFMCVMLYGLGVFISWEFNVANWGTAGRTLVGGLWLACIPLSIGLVASMEKNNE